MYLNHWIVTVYLAVVLLYITLSFQGRKGLARAGSHSTTREVRSIGLFPALCFKEVISLLVMEEVESQFMERSSLTKISNWSTPAQVHLLAHSFDWFVYSHASIIQWLQAFNVTNIKFCEQGFCQWQMLVQTPMVHNSSLQLWQLAGNYICTHKEINGKHNLSKLSYIEFF